jgi:recombination protein RecA
MDRERAVEQAISQIERQFGRGSIMKMGEERVIDIPAISTGSLALDIALGIGGVPRGRVLAYCCRGPGKGRDGGLCGC